MTDDPLVSYWESILGKVSGDVSTMITTQLAGEDGRESYIL